MTEKKKHVYKLYKRYCVCIEQHPVQDKGTSGGSDYRPRAAAPRHPRHLSAPVYTEVLL